MSYGPRYSQDTPSRVADFSAAGPAANPLGVLTPSELPLTARTGFMEFRSPDGMIGGLCQVKPGQTDILAVKSEEEGKGHFARFLDALEPQAGTLTFWSMMSETLRDILRRRGYTPVVLRDKFGERHHCMQKETHATLHAGDGDGSQAALAQGPGAAVAVGDGRPD